MRWDLISTTIFNHFSSKILQYFFSCRQQVVASGRNSVNKTKNSTRHAEMNCIDIIEDILKKDSRIDRSDYYKNLEVYVNVEPCIMCSSALLQLQVSILLSETFLSGRPLSFMVQVGAIFYGCNNERFGGCGSILNVIETFAGKEHTRFDKEIDFLLTLRFLVRRFSTSRWRRP